MSTDSIRALLAQGRYTEALAMAEVECRRRPEDHDSLFLKAVCQAQFGELASARQSLAAALATNPVPPWTWQLMSVNLARDMGALDEAEAIGATLIVAHPHPEVFNAHGVTLRALGRTTDVDRFRQALALRPSYTLARLNLARSLQQRGAVPAALVALQEGIDLDPAAMDLRIALARAHEAGGDDEAAKRAYAQAIEASDKQSFEAWWRYARLAQRRQDLFTAIDAFESALSLNRRDVDVWVWLGNAYLDVGSAGKASHCFEQALELRPDYIEVYDNLLLSYHYQDAFDADAMFEAHREWNRRFDVSSRAFTPRSAARSTEGHRLRLGFFSFDLSRPAMQAFLAPLLASLDRARFVLVGLDAVHARKGDANAIRDLFEEWHELCEPSDGFLAQRVRECQLDVSIDLDGHVPGNRLRALAQRVAPVQISWLDYFDTTGVPAMDYLIGDDISTPPSTGGQHFTEQILTLNPCRLCYLPPAYCPELASPPVERNGFITFGSFNRISKLADPLLDRWAHLLREVPQSRLILKSSAFEDSTTRRGVAQRFVSRGIAEDRLQLRGRSDHATMLAEYGDIDIALDTHPYNGGLTTCEALCMGLPVVGLRGSSMISSQTAALLSAAGLDRWIAKDAAQWHAINMALVGDIDGLRRWRTDCRRHLAASALLDGAGFAARFSALVTAAVDSAPLRKRGYA